MSFSSIPSFRSGTASPSKIPAPQSQLQNVLSPSSLSNRSSSPAPAPAYNNNFQSSSTFIPWTTSQGKLYKSIGEEAWKKCEKIVNKKNKRENFIFILFYFI
jgi:hypothetical protein